MTLRKNPMKYDYVNVTKVILGKGVVVCNRFLRIMRPFSLSLHSNLRSFAISLHYSIAQMCVYRARLSTVSSNYLTLIRCIVYLVIGKIRIRKTVLFFFYQAAGRDARFIAEYFSTLSIKFQQLLAVITAALVTFPHHH